MKLGMLAALALMVASSAGAQAPCLTTKAVVDSAHEDALLVLTSDRPVVVDLRKEQHIADNGTRSPVSVVNDRWVCAQMAGAFGRSIAPGVRFAVLRVGPLYYARDPDQHMATGVFTDSTFKVLMRLGAASYEANKP
ncbi:MAG TPA: hypothetical protein VN706_08510 [Gemmatimonadaceae bacterium]|nr:hypothetical protein [Gemmatimonadaceae bacterium]